jgi:hypothetical protein
MTNILSTHFCLHNILSYQHILSTHVYHNIDHSIINYETIIDKTHVAQLFQINATQSEGYAFASSLASGYVIITSMMTRAYARTH